jgi:transposase
LVAREHQAALPAILAQGALAYGFSTDLWTIPRIVEVAEARWGVRYSETAMWRMLKRQGLSWQRPRQQAREKDLRAVENWRRRSWPRYKKKPADEER